MTGLIFAISASTLVQNAFERQMPIERQPQIFQMERQLVVPWSVLFNTRVHLCSSIAPQGCCYTVGRLTNIRDVFVSAMVAPCQYEWAERPCIVRLHILELGLTCRRFQGNNKLWNDPCTIADFLPGRAQWLVDLLQEYDTIICREGLLSNKFTTWHHAWWFVAFEIHWDKIG